MNHGTKRSCKAGRLSGSARLSRRQFCLTALAGAAALTAVPQRVLGGRDHVPPSGKVNLAVVGTGCHGLRHITSLLANQPDVHLVAVCDVNQEGSDYFDYAGGVAGREPARRMVESHYAAHKRSGTYKGCAGYRDFREMLEKENGIDAVVVATADIPCYLIGNGVSFQQFRQRLIAAEIK